MTTVDVPGVGEFVRDEKLAWYVSAPVAVGALGGRSCRLVLDGYPRDPAPEDFHEALRVFLASDESALRAAAAPIFDYYRDTVGAGGFDPDDLPPEIADPAQVWDHIQLGDEAVVGRDHDGGVYVSLECECDWEIEHGLQIVFRGGATVSKVGPYDGHMTNGSAWGGPGRPGSDDVYRWIG